ncbi:hypothetical protein PUN28_000212 [Cardiocondyla obscurior]|uniref:Uncharacterized protein n=1 Tax=Cardiocondyla obscurior TaxID=286306 RepID=A0AAW2GY84_9HYME
MRKTVRRIFRRIFYFRSINEQMFNDNFVTHSHSASLPPIPLLFPSGINGMSQISVSGKSPPTGRRATPVKICVSPRLRTAFSPVASYVARPSLGPERATLREKGDTLRAAGPEGASERAKVSSRVRCSREEGS